MNVLNILVNRFHDADGLIAQLNEVNQSVSKGVIRSTRRFELEALQAGQVRIPYNYPFIARGHETEEWLATPSRATI